ncbi:MAG: YidC/Oxa1 family insertase periplasmic-domain containing protein [Pirellulaceae bacterium]
MDRRYIYFMVAVVLILGTHMGLRMLFMPAQPAAKKGDEKAVAQKDADKDKKEKEAKAKAGGPAPGEEKQPKGEKPAIDAGGEKPAVLKPAAGAPHKLVFLGSVDAASGYALGITLNTKGAAVERAELASEAYRDIDDASGYLAHLGLVDTKEGIRISVVGPGTPAALAKESSGKGAGGLATGDIITSLGGGPVANAAAVETYLTKETHPGDTLEIKVTRKIDGKSTPLTFTAALTRRPVQVIRPEAHEHEDGVEHDPLSFLLTLESLGTKRIETGDEEIRGLPSTISRNWNLDKQTADTAEFSLTLDAADLKSIGQTGSLKLIKRYKVAKSETPGGKNYHLDLEIEIQNVGQDAKELAYRFTGATGLPLEGWWYSNKLHRDMWAAAGARDIAWQIHDGQHHLLAAPRIYSDAKAALDNGDPAEQSLFVGDDNQSLDNVAGDTQFFAVALMPRADGETPVTFARAFAKPAQDITRINTKYIKTLNTTCVLVSPAKVLEPGKSLSTKFQVFLGPKDQDLLEQYKLEKLIERGWPYASYPAWLLQLILHFFFALTHNYGISIILLTVLVRSCMIPLSLKQAKSAAKMQELAPEMAKLKEKYKDDMEKQSTALRELYAKHKFNPFGGCLPVFLQLPIFVGLYRCLSVDIALRDADLFPGFFWASNLAGPDKLFYWKDWMIGFLADESAWLGPFFNVLPVVTCLLFIVQQKLFTPPATDEQTAMQQKMMSYMTIFMGVMFFKVPAGLCIYFIVSSLWSIVERKWIVKHKPAPAPAAEGKSGGEKDSRPAKPSPNGAGNGTAKKVKK